MSLMGMILIMLLLMLLLMLLQLMLFVMVMIVDTLTMVVREILINRRHQMCYHIMNNLVMSSIGLPGVNRISIAIECLL